MEELLLDVTPDKEARKINLSPQDILRVLKLKLGVSEDEDLDIEDLEELLLRRRGGQENAFAPTGPGGPFNPPGAGLPDPSGGRAILPGGNVTPTGGALPFGSDGGAPSFLPPDILFDLVSRMRRRRGRNFAPSRSAGLKSPAPPL